MLIVIITFLEYFLNSHDWTDWQKKEIQSQIEWVKSNPGQIMECDSIEMVITIISMSWNGYPFRNMEEGKIALQASFLEEEIWQAYEQFRRINLFCMFRDYLASLETSSPMQKHMLKIALQDLKHVSWEEGDKDYYMPLNWIMQSWYSIECQIASQEEQDEYNDLVLEVGNFYKTPIFKKWKWENIDRYRKWRGDDDDIPF